MKTVRIKIYKTIIEKKTVYFFFIWGNWGKKMYTFLFETFEAFQEFQILFAKIFQNFQLLPTQLLRDSREICQKLHREQNLMNWINNM